MFNYSDLSWSDFEKLCMEILEREYNVKLRTYAQGQDGGVDANDSAMNLAMQAKFYQRSDYNDLKKTLRAELKNVQRERPKRYVVCIGQELLRHQIEEIYEMFRGFMASTDDIYTLDRIDRLLNQPEYQDLLRRHYRLWLGSSRVLRETLFSGEWIRWKILSTRIQRKMETFVETEWFNMVKKQLEEHRIVLLSGPPGIGKTATCEMIAFHFVQAGGYKLLHAESGRIDRIIDQLDPDPDLPELIFLDDVLGQRYPLISEGQAGDLVNLLEYVESHPQKLLLLNSRITVFNGATQRFHRLERHFTTDRVACIEMNRLVEWDRARILAKYIALSTMPDQLRQALIVDRNYRKLLQHNNFSPRTVKYLTNKVDFGLLNVEDYLTFCLDRMGCAEDIWSDEYQRLSQTDRILLHLIYTFSPTSAAREILEEDYASRMRTEGIDPTVNQFQAALSRLDRAFLETGEDNRIGLANPSVGDFLDNELARNRTELDNLLIHARYVEQFKTILQINQAAALDRLEQKLSDRSIRRLRSLANNEEEPAGTIVAAIGLRKFCDREYTTEVALWFQTFLDYTDWQLLGMSKKEVLKCFLEEPLNNAYGVNELLLDWDFLEAVVGQSEFEEVLDVVDWLLRAVKVPEGGSGMFSDQEELETDLLGFLDESFQYYLEQVLIDELDSEFDRFMQGEWFETYIKSCEREGKQWDEAEALSEEFQEWYQHQYRAKSYEWNKKIEHLALSDRIQHYELEVESLDSDLFSDIITARSGMPSSFSYFLSSMEPAPVQSAAPKVNTQTDEIDALFS